MYEKECHDLKKKNDEYRDLLEETKMLFVKKDAEIKILQ
jgi:hypothetical protein